MKKLSCSGRVHPFFFDHYYNVGLNSNGFLWHVSLYCPSLPQMTTLKKAPLLKPLQVYSADNQLISEYGGKLSVPVEL